MQDNAFHYRFTTLILAVLNKKKKMTKKNRIECDIGFLLCWYGGQFTCKV